MACAAELPTTRLLLVEDNPGDLTLIREQLSEAGWARFEMDHASTLEAALEMLAARDVDLVLVDLGLPDSCGLDTVTRLLAVGARAPVVVLSGVADEHIAWRALALGAEDFLTKGVGVDALARCIRYALERNRLKRDLRELVERNTDAMVVVDAGGYVVFVNPAAEAFFARSADLLVGTRFDYAPQAPGTTQATIETGGGRREAEIRAAEIRWDARPAYLMSIRDVTDRERAAELEKRLRRADLMASIGQLAAGVAHEICNPAAFLTLNLEQVQGHLEALGQALPGAADGAGDVTRKALVREATEMLSDCRAGVDRIVAVVRDMRAFSQIRDSELELVDINDIAELACKVAFNEVRHRGRLVRDFGTIPKIVGDRGKLSQVVINLLVNAAHAIEAGQAGSNTVRVRTRHEKGAVVLTVEDTGCGIPQAQLERVFEPFFTTKPRDLGTGLGLSVSAEAVRKHGGEIRVHSVIGEGTRFEVVLPEDNGLRLSTPPLKKVEAAAPRARILLIDDDPFVRRAVMRMLTAHHDVVEASNGREGLEQIMASPSFDVVLCDLMMPEVDGAAVWRGVMEHRREYAGRIVYISGGAFTPSSRKFLDECRAEVLDKPISSKTLLGVIDRILNAPPRQA